MIFHHIATERGCQSYLLGCPDSRIAVVIDPEIHLIERYLGLAAQSGLTIRYLLDTHTHADHFSAVDELATELSVSVIMHRLSPARYVSMAVDDGEIVYVGNLALNILHTPGHTADSICVRVKDQVFTGDTLLIGGTGRTDLPSGDAGQLYDSLFNKLLLLDPGTRIYPAHIYSERQFSTIGEEAANNKRLRVTDREKFIEMMQSLNLSMPEHLSEALRTNLTGCRTVDQMISEAAQRISFMSQEEILRRIQSDDPDITLLDVREHDSFQLGHLPGAISIPRGQLELRVNELLPDPTARIVTYCQYGKISTLAAATLRDMGFTRSIAMELGIQTWLDRGYPTSDSLADDGVN
jgi:glyoxylase-like metal-dependent hydrolase (beta-lactamase superfamily II)/rhodanese-related sulfurtransferase